KEYREQTGALKTTLDQQQSLISKLDTETGQLLDALKRPSVRGRWGEVTLKRLVELSGMSSYCDFTEQMTVEGEDGKLRPDMVINLPNDRMLVIDAKTSADHYLKALETEDGDEQQRELKEFARTVKDRMRELGKKDYWKRFERSPEFVIQFLPGESFFATALEHDHSLIEAGSEAGVMLSSPLTLMSLLLAVKQGWKEEALQENAKEIAAQGRELYNRLYTMTEHLDRLGNSIAAAMGHYNSLIGSVEGRLLPAARKFKELEAASGKEIESPEKREIPLRSITASELRSSGDDGDIDS
ncbi:DNA recombination protein RmuC, partial [bacterium]|nr:DNA recombination protein RmuC [bacterium]